MVTGSHPTTTVDELAVDLLKKIGQGSCEESRKTLGDLAGRLRDWESLLNLAREHRVLSLLALRLAEVETAVPASVQHRLQSEYERNAFHCVANASELVALLRAFSEHQIDALPFKGIVLAASIYPDMTWRSAGDLDLLVGLKDLRRATHVLESRGFELKTPIKRDGSPAFDDYYEFHFERPADAMIVELRWRLELLPRRFRHDLGMEWVWPRRTSVNISGVPVPALDEVSNLLILCMHGTKHHWSRMNWICDVAQILKTHANLNWRIVSHEAKRRGLWRSVALGVLLAQRVCSIELPQEVLRSFASDTDAQELAIHFEESLFIAPGELPDGPLPFSFRILDQRDRFRWLLTMEFLRPRETDLAFVRLPRILKPLYFLVRPIRLLFDRSPR